MTSTETTMTKTNHSYFRVLTVLAALVLVASLLVAMTAKPAHAATTTYTVNSTGNEDDQNLIDDVCDVDLATAGDQCTLSAAISNANLDSGLKVINFNIPGSGVHTIKPSKELSVPGGTLINGYSQPGSSPNTLLQGSNAVLKIELDGSAAQPVNGAEANGLRTFTGDSVIRGLAINNYKNNGILINGGQNSKVEGNFIGTDASGAIAKPNTNNGVLIKALDGGSKPTNNTVGGTTPAARNVLSGNFGGGISIEDPFTRLLGPTVTNNRVLGNLIGTDKNGTGSLGNSDGVSIFDASDNTVGGTASGEANTIAFNSPAGVSISGNGTGNRVLSNSIFSNSGMAIDLGRDGVTANDTGDADAGANTLQNFPVVTSAKTGKKGTSIAGKLNSIPNKTFTVQFFASPEPSPSGNGQGKTFLGEKVVTTDASANATFTFKPAQKVSKGQFITATATDTGGNNTSEFSAAKKVVRQR
jgi:hypothetical protein